MLHPNLRAAADLTWFFRDSNDDIEHDKRSAQARWEAELEARSKRARHRGFSVTLGTEIDPRTVHVRGTDLGCGCSVHCGQGDERPETRPGIDDGAVHAATRQRQIKAGLDRADDQSRHPDALGRGCPWTCPALPSDVLRLRFRELLPRARWPFDPSGKALFTQTKAPPLAEGFRQNDVRGPGNLAHLTFAAIGAFGRRAADRVDALGRRVGGGGIPTPLERALLRQISAEVVVLEMQGVTLYARAARSLPDAVLRRARFRAS